MVRLGVRFGVFPAPFHALGENLTLAMDMELIEWLGHMGHDEAWIGAHHSAGWKIIAGPEIFIGASLQRTRHIGLGSGSGETVRPISARC